MSEVIGLRVLYYWLYKLYIIPKVETMVTRALMGIRLCTKVGNNEIASVIIGVFTKESPKYSLVL